MKVLDINKIARATLNFMVQNKIPLYPKEYERWFSIFAEILEKGIDVNSLSTPELVGMYKDKFEGMEEYKEEKFKGFIDDTDKILLKTIESLDKQERSLKSGKEKIELVETYDKILLLKILDRILDEYAHLKEEIKKQHQKLDEIRKELLKTKEELQIDSLTQLLNRREFDNYVKKLTKNEIPFSFILIDLDNFKCINDTYGHLAGDRVLQEVGRTLRLSLRKGTPIFRIGGEEFAVVLPEVELKDACKIAERLRNMLQNKIVKFESKIIRITGTFSVVFSDGKSDFETVFKRADEMLYKGKKNGKNIVVGTCKEKNGVA